MIELFLVGVGQRVLVQSAAEPSADADVLTRLHKKSDALDRGDFRPQALDDLVRGHGALVMRLQLHEQAGGVLSRVVGGGAGEGEDPGDVGIRAHNVDDLLHQLGHLVIRDVLSRVGLSKDEAGILLREKALGDRHIKIAGQYDQRQGRQQGRQLVAEDKVETAVIASQHPVEGALGNSVEAAGGMQPLFLEEKRAQDRGQGQRDRRRRDDRHRKR